MFESLRSKIFGHSQKVLNRRAVSQNIIEGKEHEKQSGNLINWHTEKISPEFGAITHIIGWESSTGNLKDLKHIRTREKVTWASACPWANTPEDPTYTEPGQHFGVGNSIVTQGDLGGNTDTHIAAAPLFNDKYKPFPLKEGQVMEFVMEQVYEYSENNGETWYPIKGSEYTLIRRLSRITGEEKYKYQFELSKIGKTDEKVDLTVSVVV